MATRPVDEDPSEPDGGLPLVPPVPPFRGNLLGEARVQAELAMLLLSGVYRGRGVPRGDGAPVLAVPGFLAGDASLAVLRGWLRRMGHRTYRAGIAWNVDCSEASVRRLDRRLAEITERAGRPVTIIGHSRGGLLGYAVAVRRPSRVRQVITLGSPLSSPFDASLLTLAAVGGARLGQNLLRPARPECLTTACPCAFGTDLRASCTVPVTSIRSREDGIVRPDSCTLADDVAPVVRNVVVRGSHLGLATNRAVYAELARLL